MNNNLIDEASSKDLKPLVKLDNVCFSFKKESKNSNFLLNNINLTIYENQIISVIGINGVGKTTLLEIIAKLETPNIGKVTYYEQNAKNTKFIGIQPQDLNFPIGLSVKNIVEFVAMLNNIKLKTFSEINDMLKIFKLENLWKHKASKLSGGQKQRLNLFISLLSKPSLLILDEYSTGLDLTSKKQIEAFILNYIKKYNITLIFTSHDLDGILLNATRYVIIKSGTIQTDISHEEAINKFKSIKKLIEHYS